MCSCLQGLGAGSSLENLNPDPWTLKEEGRDHSLGGDASAHAKRIHHLDSGRRASQRNRERRRERERKGERERGTGTEIARERER